MKDKILEVLSKGYLMSLGTHDEGGVWVADVIYVYDDDLNIYWMSDPDCRHSKAIGKNSQCALSITVTNQGKAPNLGVQLSGKAEKIEGARHDLASKHFKKRGKPEPSEDQDVLEGDSWYVLHPTRVDLIDEENYGYDKKSIDL